MELLGATVKSPEVVVFVLEGGERESERERERERYNRLRALVAREHAGRHRQERRGFMLS